MSGFVLGRDSELGMRGIDMEVGRELQPRGWMMGSIIRWHEF